MNSKLKSILNIALDIFIVLFLVFALIILLLSLSQKTEEGGKPSQLFGYSFRSVVSDSMEPHHEDGSEYKADNGFYKGDLLFLKVTDENETYSVGDTVMFWMPFNAQGEQCSKSIYTTKELTTHEIVRIEEGPDGQKLYYTQGLNRQAGKNLVEDKLPKTADEFVAKYEGKRIGGVGYALTFIKSGFAGLKNEGSDSWGFFLCVLLPILIFVIIQAIRVIKNFVAYKAQKAAVAAASGELSEEQKRLIAEEYMKTLNTSNSPEAAPEKKPEEAEETSSEESQSESEAETQE